MAIDFPASPTNGQTFTSGSVTYTWDGTKWTAVAAAGSSNSISQGNTNATVTDTGSDGRFVVTTEGSERLRVTNTGLVGIGSNSPRLRTHIVGAAANAPTLGVASGSLIVGPNDNDYGMMFGVSGSGWGWIQSQNFVTPGGAAYDLALQPSGGRLLVGTSTARSNIYLGGGNDVPKFQIEGSGSNYSTSLSLIHYSSIGTCPAINIGVSLSDTPGTNTAVGSNTEYGIINFVGNDGTNFRSGAQIKAACDGGVSAGDLPSRLVFSTTADGASSPTERMRISQNGAINTFTGIEAGGFRSGNTTSSSEPALDVFGGASSTVSGTRTFSVRANGNVVNQNNSYGSLSDIKLKENIVDATTQWNDIKSLQVRKYNFKEETGQQTHTQIGLIAQEVELVSPGLVSESPDRDAEGNDLGTVTKSVNYSVLYMKAVKALQEAMERIETLEAKVAALESA